MILMSFPLGELQVCTIIRAPEARAQAMFLRRQLVCQLGPPALDYLAHLIRDNADAFNIEHIFMKAP
jgi:hypothetical protein